MLEHAIETGRGGVYLRLTPQRSGKPRWAKAPATWGSRSWAQTVKLIWSAKSAVEIQKPATSPFSPGWEKQQGEMYSR